MADDLSRQPIGGHLRKYGEGWQQIEKYFGKAAADAHKKAQRFMFQQEAAIYLTMLQDQFMTRKYSRTASTSEFTDIMRMFRSSEHMETPLFDTGMMVNALKIVQRTDGSLFVGIPKTAKGIVDRRKTDNNTSNKALRTLKLADIMMSLEKGYEVVVTEKMARFFMHVANKVSEQYSIKFGPFKEGQTFKVPPREVFGPVNEAYNNEANGHVRRIDNYNRKYREIMGVSFGKVQASEFFGAMNVGAGDLSGRVQIRAT